MTPKGWDHVDVLVGLDLPDELSPSARGADAFLQVDPYTYTFNNVVMSENGKRPVSYPGYHQTDVVRAKALV